MTTRRLVRVVGIDAYMAVRYGTSTAAAAVQPVEQLAPAPLVASSHRTSAQPARRNLAFPYMTPLGVTSRFSR